MKRVVWLKQAVEDLRSIGAYIALENPEAAYRTLAHIKAAADMLEQHPLMGRLGRNPESPKEIRELVVPSLPYILPYYIEGAEIRILAVMHTSRKWPDTFSGQ